MRRARPRYGLRLLNRALLLIALIENHKVTQKIGNLNCYLRFLLGVFLKPLTLYVFITETFSKE